MNFRKVNVLKYINIKIFIKFVYYFIKIFGTPPIDSDFFGCMTLKAILEAILGCQPRGGIREIRILIPLIPLKPKNPRTQDAQRTFGSNLGLAAQEKRKGHEDAYSRSYLGLSKSPLCILGSWVLGFEGNKGIRILIPLIPFLRSDLAFASCQESRNSAIFSSQAAQVLIVCLLLLSAMASFDVVGKVRFSNGAAELRIQPASSPASSQAYKVDKEKPRVALDEVLEQHERGAIKIHDSRLPLDQRALRSMMYNTQKTLNIEPLGHMGRWTEECHEKLLRDLQAPKGHVRGRKRRDRLAILDANTQDPLPIQDAPVQQEQQLAEDHQGTSEKDEGMSEKDEGVFEDQQGVSKKNEGVSEDNHGISEGVSKKDEGV